MDRILDTSQEVTWISYSLGKFNNCWYLYRNWRRGITESISMRTITPVEAEHIRNQIQEEKNNGQDNREAAYRHCPMHTRS